MRYVYLYPDFFLAPLNKLTAVGLVLHAIDGAGDSS
jgi:hypothetical protein